MKYLLRGAVVASLALATLGQPDVVQAKESKWFVAEQPAPRLDYWQKRAKEISSTLAARNSLKPVRLLFIGDSITDFWHLDANPWFKDKWCGRQIWEESFAGSIPAYRALNLGVSGDRIEHMLYRIQPRVKGGSGWLDRQDLQPDTIFLMLGINNSFDAEDPAVDSIYSGILATIASIHAQKPKARIVIQSLLPTDDQVKNRDLVVPLNTRLNAYVTTAGKANRLAYLELYSSFVDPAGKQRTDLFNDGLHPSREGYAVWRDRLIAYLGGA